MRRITPLVLSLALIAGSSATGDTNSAAAPPLGPQSPADLAREMAEAPRPRPGLYVVTRTVTRSDETGEKRSELAELMKDEIGKPKVSHVCVIVKVGVSSPFVCNKDFLVVDGATMESQISCNDRDMGLMVTRSKVVMRGNHSERFTRVELTPPGATVALVTESTETRRRIGKCSGKYEKDYGVVEIVETSPLCI